MAKSEPQFYKPADACRMAEVAPYVLRYWETEFPPLSEGKEKGSARLYTARDVQIIARIRQLLYDEGFTVAGAKKRLEAEIQDGRFDDGGKAPPIAEQRKREAEDAKVAAAARSVPAAPPAAVTPNPAPRAAVSSSDFPERRVVIKELKEIVKLLDKRARR